jgi:hypothetical protein
MAELEKDIESAILKWSNFQLDIMAFKINTVGVYDLSRGVYRTNNNPFIINGTSDILGILRTDFGGIFLAVEVKTKKTIGIYQKQRDPRSINQKRFLDRVREKGGFSICVSSLSQYIKWIEHLRKLTQDFQQKQRIQDILKQTDLV